MKKEETKKGFIKLNYKNNPYGLKTDEEIQKEQEINKE